jgi:tripartite-type tricarboxylate transporter receptor subunit TctC
MSPPSGTQEQSKVLGSAPSSAPGRVPAIAAYPAKPVTLVLPFPLGGSTGYTATVLAGELRTLLGQPFIVEVKTGNYGINAMQHLVDNADGYTLLVGNLTSNSMTPVLHHEKMGFVYRHEILPVSRVAEFPSVVMTQPSFPAETLAGFLAHLKKSSGKLVYGTDFLGAYVDVDAIALGEASGLEVAYHATDGASGILADLVAGRIDVAFLNAATASANVGKFKPLAVFGPSRLANFPNVPTMAEAGFEGIGTGNWQGLFAPRRTPSAIVQLLHRSVIAAMNTDRAKAAFRSVDARITTSVSPEAFAAEIEAETVKWRRMIPQIMALPQADQRERVSHT